MIFDSTDKNKELLKKYQDVWNGIKNKIEAISSSECDNEKDLMKIKFNSDDNLPLSKPLKFYMMTIIISSVFKKDKKTLSLSFFKTMLSRIKYIKKMLLASNI